MEADDALKSWAGECHQLLMGLKCTVERLLAVQASNVWSTYGGFKRVSAHVEAILCHRIKPTQMFSPTDGIFWPFVHGLKWLRPGMTSTMEQVSRSSHSAGQGGKGQMWLRESLQDHSLSSQLEILVSDAEHLHYHYQEGAFLCHVDYVEAMLICLHAVETNKVAGLADINPRLLQPQRLPQLSIVSQTSCNSQRCNIMERSLSFEENAKSSSTPDLASSPLYYNQLSASGSYSTIGDGLSMPNSATTSTFAFGTSVSTPPPHTFFIESGTSSSPEMGSFYTRMHTDPLTAVQYGTSPPLPDHSLTSLQNSGEVFTAEMELGTGMANGPLKKCMSDSFAPPHEEEMEPGVSLSVSKPDTTQKKIHIPGRNGRNDASGAWLSVNDQRRASSETKKMVSGGVKGHKRSQSDMGVRANHVSMMSSEKESMDRPAASEVGKKAFSKSQKVSLHGGDSLLHPPAKGQSLMSYLSEQDFNCCALLERENAHFGISDVLISVFEQMKWEKLLRKHSLADNASEEEESDDEINELKQRIRLRRRERLVEKAKKFPANSDGMNDTSTTSSAFSACSPLSSHGFSSLSDLSDQSDDADDQIELTFSGSETSNLAKLKSSGLSLSMASLYSDAELRKSNLTVENRAADRQTAEKSNFSAEAIALSLLSQFSEKRLPKASELDWLVSETDAPQALLPLPDSYPISPYDGENADLMQAGNQTKLRGNLEWAPPRAQIIFTIHPQEKRNVLLSKQNMRCAGCGTKTEPGFVKRLRYCEYMGKYFCQCCHTNETEVIPGRVIMRWDFTQCCVSNFARDLLKKIHKEPLFHVDAINMALYRKVRTLEAIRDYRRQLGHLYTLLIICKRNTKWLQEMDRVSRHWMEDDNLYSMEDFFAVRNGRMLLTLKGMVSEAVHHVNSCPLCQGLGFICEICQETEVIFPFQLQQVSRCPVCQACYHKSCFIPGKCPKCSRMEIRRRRQAQLSPGEVHSTVWEGGGGGVTPDLCPVFSES
ncbi:run domain Beclin-1-interacting and cysteine-rich domain-containing protein-like isoform X2 [Babylonia areolata]|uniref:run domain Beclin-1-interacting and cysteine-rich domain-containing protein-like isoform X2 n=1 Tax=Babylonia areolata TaxID=304850 RepID=UPI003FD3DFA8